MSPDGAHESAEDSSSWREWPYILLGWVALPFEGVVERWLSLDRRLARAERRLRFPAAGWRWYGLTEAALLNAEAGNLTRATEQAAKLLAQSSQGGAHEGDPDAIHKAHQALGLVALKSGDVEAARTHLIASAQVDGSPVLCSFGPSMVLALEMLRAGEQAAVLEYLDLCARFWRMGLDQVRGWKESIAAGVEPDFDDNLAY